jgi:L,D-transpeptidase catalytic domain
MSAKYCIGRREFLSGATALVGAAAFGSSARGALTEAELMTVARRELARAGRGVWLTDMVGLADFSLPSWQPRFFLVDMIGGLVRPFYVSHGFGSDPGHSGWLHSFSNERNSLATSRGSYITHTWYEGQNGTSLRLSGIDSDNSNAEARAIVIHGARYSNPEMIATWGKLGRSSGCFAFPTANLMEILARLGPGRLLFADQISAVQPESRIVWVPTPEPVAVPPTEPAPPPPVVLAPAQVEACPVMPKSERRARKYRRTPEPSRPCPSQK